MHTTRLVLPWAPRHPGFWARAHRLRSLLQLQGPKHLPALPGHSPRSSAWPSSRVLAEHCFRTAGPRAVSGGPLPWPWPPALRSLHRGRPSSVLTRTSSLLISAKGQSVSRVRLCATPRTAALQAPLCMEFQAGIPECFPVSSSRASSLPRDRTQVSCLSRRVLYP